jgi:hypothetical protein
MVDTEEVAALRASWQKGAALVLGAIKDLHSAVINFGLGDSEAEDLGVEKIYQDNVPLDDGANSIGSYIIGSAEPTEEQSDPWDDRTLKMVLDKTQGKHRVLLDLDVPHVYVPSTTAGHGHLVIDVSLGWTDYMKLLIQLSSIGILQEGFVNATAKRGETWLRAPGIMKPTEGDLL